MSSFPGSLRILKGDLESRGSDLFDILLFNPHKAENDCNTKCKLNEVGKFKT